MRSNKSLRALLPRASAVVVAAAVAGVMNMSVAHASSGGGCNQDYNGGKFSDQVCISAQGSSLLPDYYIVSESGCTSAEFALVDATTNIAVQDLRGLSCSVGHHGPYKWSAPTNGHQYFSALTLTIGSVALNAGSSPLETFQN